MSDIIVNSENFKRFSKRLHKAMTTAELHVNLSQTQQLLSKAFGCSNVHELEQQFAKNSGFVTTKREAKFGEAGSSEWYEETYGVKSFGPHAFKKPEINFLSHASLLKPFISEQVERTNNLIYAVAHILNYLQSIGYSNNLINNSDSPLQILEKSLTIKNLLNFETGTYALELKLPITQYLDDIGRGDRNKYAYLETHDEILKNIKNAVYSTREKEWFKFVKDEEKEYADVDAFHLELMDKICSNSISPVKKCYQIDSELILQFKNLKGQIEDFVIELFDFQEQKSLRKNLNSKMGSFGDSFYTFLLKHFVEKRKNTEDSNLFGYQLLKRNLPNITYGKVVETKNIFYYKCEVLPDDSEIIFKGRVLQKEYALADSSKLLNLPLQTCRDRDKIFLVFGSTRSFSDQHKTSLNDIIEDRYVLNGNLQEAMKTLLKGLNKQSDTVVGKSPKMDAVVGIYKEPWEYEGPKLILSNEIWNLSKLNIAEQNPMLTKEPSSFFIKSEMTTPYDELSKVTETDSKVKRTPKTP